MSDAKHYLNPDELFKRVENYELVMVFYENEFSISFEELYQVFKKRMLSETLAKGD